MMRKIIKKFNCLILVIAMSQMAYAQDNVPLDSVSKKQIYDKEIELPFNSITSKKSTGSVIIIDVEKELKRDQGATIASAINGKVPGVFGNYNTWGTGNAVVLVDGIRQSDFYLEGVNLLEVESIVILKDATSKAMYGSIGDQGVVLVATKRGEAGTHELRISGSYTTSEARALPNYLNAADYMTKYKEAQLNDGVDPMALKYSQEAIDGTRSGTNPARYPDNDFYSDDYIRDFRNTINVFADAKGGSENVNYYVSTGYTNNSGWLNTPVGDVTNRMNFRGNLDVKISDMIKLSVNTAARLSFNEQPNSNSIWGIAETELPNNYPVTWDPSIIPQDIWDNFDTEPILVNGQLLGGTSSFQNNIYGNFTRNGRKKDMNREAQFGLKLDVDMSFITEGLSGKVYGGMNFFNSIFSRQNPSFKVYNPIFDNLTGEMTGVDEIGDDISSNRFNTVQANSDFFRQITYYGTLNYNRSFGDHAISATALVNSDQISIPDEIQIDAQFHTGLSTNYMFKNKYVAEVSIMGIGSRKLKDGNRMEWAPSFGLGWVLSQEDFLSETSFINYLKVRTSFGISKNDISYNDNWDNYYLYKSTFTRGGNFNYNNGNINNSGTSYATAPNEISLQTRRDITFGVDAILFDEKMNVQLGFFSSEALDQMTERSSTYPQILGYQDLVINNYNSDITNGIEFGLNYRFDINSDFSLIAGANLLYISPEHTQREEPFYEGVDAALLRDGTASDAMWALKSNGLYSEADFNADGTLVGGLPEPSYGAVQPGDIKYLDQNGDNIIDQLDQRIVGHGKRTQYSLYLDLKYKKFQFYVLGIGSGGDSNYRTGDYYRVGGNNKYSDQANLAYGPNNMDVNAMHPRLSTTNVSNNNRNSDYWLYKNNSFIIPTMQITYNFKGADKLGFLKDSRVYARATNVAVFGENKEYTEINIGGAPKTRSIALGLIASF